MSSPACATHRPVPHRSRIRVLVVHQSASHTAAIASILERNPRVDVIATALDGIIGLRTALAHPPDLIVMDASTCLSGFETPASLRRQLPEAKIILVATGANGHIARMVAGFTADAILTTDTLSVECESQLTRLFPA